MQGPSADELLRIQRDLCVALSSTSDLIEALDSVLQFALKIDEVDAGGIYLVDAQSGGIDLAAHIGLPPEFVKAVAHYDSDSPEVKLVVSGGTYYGDDSKLSPATVEAKHRVEIRAVSSNPVCHGGQVVALLNLASYTRDEFSENSRHMIEAITARLGGAIVRIRAQAALQSSERRHRSLIENMPDHLLILDGEATIRFINHVHADSRLENVLGANAFDLLVPRQHEQYRRLLERVLETREMQQGLFQSTSGIWFESRFMPLAVGRSARDVMVIATDITDRMRAERSLRESQEKFDAFIRQSAYAYTEIDLEGNLLYANQRATDIFGFPLEEMVGRNIGDFLGEADFQRAVDNLSKTLVEPLATTQHYEVRTKDGGFRSVEANAVGMVKDGETVGFQVTLLDVTEHKAAERAVLESEAKLRNLFENIPDFVVVADRQATIQYANRGVPSVPAEEMVGAAGFGFVVPESQPACREALAATFETRQVQHVEVVDVHGIWWDCRLVPMVEDGEVSNVMVICADVTEQRKASENVQKEQRLLRQLLDLHERDRQVLAYEIHDGFAQQLTAALFHLDVFDRLSNSNPEEARRNLEVARQAITRSIDETRRLISGLRPPILDELGIVAAVDYLINENRENGGPEIEFAHDVRLARLAPPLESAVFRIIQESLANACRHSQSEKIRVRLLQSNGRVMISVRDWGIGFDETNIEQHHFGLQGIRERVRLLGGQIAIDTATGQGTRIAVELPLVEKHLPQDSPSSDPATESKRGPDT